MRIIWNRIFIQTLLFQACLLTRQNGVENRDKAYTLLCLIVLPPYVKKSKYNVFTSLTVLTYLQGDLSV